MSYAIRLPVNDVQERAIEDLLTCPAADRAKPRLVQYRCFSYQAASCDPTATSDRQDRASPPTMLQTFLRCPDVDIVYWILAVELVFYFGMAILNAAGQLGRSVLVSGIWLALSAASGIAGRYVDVPGWLNTYLILPHIPFFIAGTMFYLIWRARPERGHTEGRPGMSRSLLNLTTE